MTGVGKRYRYGQIGAGTLQGDLKEWAGRRRSRSGEDRVGPERAGEYFFALKDIDLTIRRGETLGIIGRNGAGKSTLLKLLSRITIPTEGDIDIYGRVASMLEVGAGFHGEMTGRENIYLNGAILGMTRKEIEEKMEDIIGFSEVRDFIDTPVKRYSSGMYVKLGFSVAAHLDSEIIIMDEVLAVGDMAFQHKSLDRMRKAAREEGKTVLYVSHNMNTVRHLCDRCIVMEEGRIVFDGDTDEAIGYYTGGNGHLQHSFVFGPEYRPYDEYIRLERRFDIEALTVLDRDLPDYEAGERPRIRIACTAEQAFPRVGLRLEFWSRDGVKIGTMLAGSFADIRPGRNHITAELDLRNLAAGEYRADLVAYLFDEDGNEDILDGVYPGLILNVRRRTGQGEHLDWHHKYWGHVRLNDLQITDSGTERDIRDGHGPGEQKGNG